MTSRSEVRMLRIDTLLRKVELAIMMFERLYPDDKPPFLLSLKRAIRKEEARQRDRAH